MHKEGVIEFLGLVGVVILVVGGWFWPSLELLVFHPDYAAAATSSQVTVSATVEATISCSTSATSTAFGTLTDASVFTSSPNVSSTLSCANSAPGCTLYVKDAGSGSNPGLWNATSSSLIESPNAAFNATATLVAGTEGYGIQAATTTAGSGATLTINARYNQTGNTVGGLTLTNTSLASANATTSGREAVVTHKAAIAASTPAGTYTDTITYECTAN